MSVTPQAALIRFGTEVRKRREERSLTQKQLAQAVHLSQGQISAIERGTKGTTEDHVVRIDQVLNANGVLVHRWHDGRSRTQGIAPWFEDVALAQEQSTLIRQYHPTLIPGLLQTDSYIRTIIRSRKPSYSNDEIEQLIKGRLERQKILTSDHPPWFVVVLDEPWLRRPTGGRDTMRKQLQALVQASQRPRITLHVIPTATENHPGHDGAFELFTVRGKGEIAYVETLWSGVPSDDPGTLDVYRRVFAELRGAALPEQASLELIRKIIEEFQ